MSLRVGRRVDAVHISDRVALDVSKYQKGGELWPAIRNIVEIGRASIDETIDDIWLGGEKSHFQALGTILREARTLRELQFHDILRRHAFF